DSAHNVDHAKFLVVDGQELLFGSGNLVRSGIGGNRAQEFDTRDFWVRDRRSSAGAEAKSLFQADWARTPTPTLGFDSLVVTPDNDRERILGLIRGAQTRLYVYNQSLSDDEVIRALIEAKSQRHVDVHVLLGFQPGTGGAPPKNQIAIDKLGAAGI